MTRLPATTLVPGAAAGPILALAAPLSFWGGLDAATGRIIDRWHPQHGATVSGHVLLMASGRGSSSGSSVLAEALRRGTGPAAILLLVRDPIVTMGAMVAAELYARPCPVLLARAADWPLLTAARHLAIDAADDRAAIRAAPPDP